MGFVFLPAHGISSNSQLYDWVRNLKGLMQPVFLRSFSPCVARKHGCHTVYMMIMMMVMVMVMFGVANGCYTRLGKNGQVC